MGTRSPGPWLAAVTVTIAAAACAAPTIQPGASVASDGIGTQGTPTAEASLGPELRLVALGDSIATPDRCECVPFPTLYGRLVEQALGQPVRAQNLAVPGTTSADLSQAVRTAAPTRDAVAAADIITVTIGINDINPCAGEDDAACYESGIADVEANLEAILAEIDALKGGTPFALRGTAYYNFEIGSSGTSGSGPAYQEFYAERLAELNNTICSAVEGHGGLCADLVTVFNGPQGDADAGSLLAFDHEHPSAAGHEAIAETFADLGFEPLD